MHSGLHTLHLCLPLLNVCVCVYVCCFYVEWPVRLQLQPAGLKARLSLSPFPVFPTSPRMGFKGHCLQVYPCLFCSCVSARPWRLYQTGDSGLQFFSLGSTANYLKGCQSFPMFAQCLSLLQHRKLWHGPQGPCASPLHRYLLVIQHRFTSFHLAWRAFFFK